MQGKTSQMKRWFGGDEDRDARDDVERVWGTLGRPRGGVTYTLQWSVSVVHRVHKIERK